METQEVKNRVRGQWFNIHSAIVPAHVVLDPKRHGPCPLPGCPDGGGKDRFRWDNKEDDGTWICNRCGAGDGIELYRRINGLTYPQALAALVGRDEGGQGEKGTTPAPAPTTKAKAQPEKKFIIPAPEPVKGALAHKVLGEPVGFWRYVTADGSLVGYTCRYQGQDGQKVITPWAYVENKGWTSTGLPKPWPLYNLLELGKRPKDPVLIVEGEKTADAATRLFPGAVVVSLHFGSVGVPSADLIPLTNRTVMILPDSDEPGQKFAVKLEASLKGIVKQVQQVTLPEEIPITVSGGWDVADGGPHLETVVQLVEEMLVPEDEETKKPVIRLDGDNQQRSKAIYRAIKRTGGGLLAWNKTLATLEIINDATTNQEQKQLQPLDGPLTQKLLTERFYFEVKNYKPEGGEWIRKQLHISLAQYIAIGPPWPFPLVKRLIRAPVFGPDKQLAMTTGYHQNIFAWLELGDLQLDIAQVPQPWQVEHSRNVIHDLLIDFPFQDAASYANAVAMLLLPFVRLMIQGPTPLHMVSAPVYGSGKTLLVDLVSQVATGVPLEAIGEGSNEEEWKKEILSTMIKSPSVICIDNVAKKLESAQLARTLASVSTTGRILGVSKMITVANDAVWAATGNNPTISGELVRRIIWIRLKPDDQHPSSRNEFTHSPLLPWAMENRQELLTACLTIIQSWIAAGALPGGAVLGSFESWAGTMSGILANAGIPDFMANAATMRDLADEESTEWGEFTELWIARHGSAIVGIAELYALAQEKGYFDDILGDGSERSRKTIMGNQLKDKVDRVFGIWRIARPSESSTKSRSNRGSSVYRLEIAKNEEHTPGPAE